jgi:purine nucleoside phosphorylase
MCCESEGRHGGHHRGGCGCGCGCSTSGPAFWTKAEKIARLEQVLADLVEETKAVEARIAALKGEE